MNLADHAETIARALLGTPNAALSTKAQLRYGTNGSLAIEISGDKCGAWYDHELETGGGLLDLIMRERSCDKAGALAWLKSDLGIDVAVGNGASAQPQRRTAVYIYRDERGEPLYCVSRWGPLKTFSQERYDPATGKYLSGVKGIEPVPYRLPELLASDGRVWVCEGEKDCDRLAGLGLVATTNPGGVGKWPADFAKHFAGRDVIIIPDNDKAGRDHARDVAASLTPVARSVRILELPALLPKQDVSDWLDHGHTVEQLVGLLEEPEEVGLYTPRAVHSHLHTPPKLADSRDILSVLDRALGACRVVGERRNAKLVYLALTSRLLAEPVSLVIKGVSSAGKSYTIEAVLKFVPEAAVITMTAMSERALVYMKEEFSHRTLVLFEATALREQREKAEGNLTAYFVRSLLSEGRISYPVTVRGEHGFETRIVVKDGPTNLILSTTSISLHGENETRMLSLPIDDTADQTRAILLELANDAAATVNYADWHDLQHWLAGAEHRVSIPYARRLAESVPPVAVRLRRDFRAILNLIRTHAVLHQCHRQRDETGRIIATPEDYAAVRALVADLVADGVGATVPATVRETVEIVRAVPGEDGITVNAVAERLRIDRSAAQYRLSNARARGFIKNVEQKRGAPARYVTGDPLPDELVLLPVDLGEGCESVNPVPDAAPNLTSLNTNDNSGWCEGVNAPRGGYRDDVPDSAPSQERCVVCHGAIVPGDRAEHDGIALHPSCAAAVRDWPASAREHVLKGRRP
jgi:hypothetical protein